MKVDIKNHAEFSKYLMMGLTKSVERSLLSTAMRLVGYIQTDVIPNTKPFQPVDRGTFRAGWRIQRGHKRVDILNLVPHASFIEYGVRSANVKPGRAMIEALTAWVKRKGVGAKSSSVKTKKPVKLKGEEATSMAWAIAMSMKKKGIFSGNALPLSGYRIIDRAMLKFDSFFRDEMAREMSKNIR